MADPSYLEQLGSIRLFSGCNKSDLQRIAKSVDEISVDEGRVLTTEGDFGREAFVVVSGTARVNIDGTEVATLGPGQQFGELALLDGGPRTATVTALSPMELVVIDQRSFLSLLDEVPGLARRILASLASTIRELDTQVAERPTSH